MVSTVLINSFNFPPPIPNPLAFCDFVTLLMPMDGADAGSTFINTFDNAEVFTANGGVTTDTEEVKFGTTAQKNTVGVNTYVSTPDKHIAAGGNTPYTIECWVYIIGDAFFGSNRIAATSFHAIYMEESNITNGNQGFWVNHDGSVRLFRGSSMPSGGESIRSTAGDVPRNEWVHVAACYDNVTDTAYLFSNGTKVAEDDYLGGGWDRTTQPVRIGSSNLPSFSVWDSTMNGYIDDLRVTEAVRYTEDFTPPDAPFPIACPPKVYIHSTGTIHTDTGYYIHGSILPRAPAVTVLAPDRAAGDLLLALTYSPGGNIADTGGNWTTTVQGASNWREVYARTATGDADDDYILPQTSGNQFDQRRERFVQIICIKAESGTPTILEVVGSTVSSNVAGDYTVINRTLPAVETMDILAIANYSGQDEAAGSITGTTPYGLLSVPPGTTEIGEFGAGFNQPNAKYWITGWSYEYMDTVSTKAASGLMYNPDPQAQNFGVESSWIAIYEV